MIGSACWPCVRPGMTVSACSSASCRSRSRMAARSSAMISSARFIRNAVPVSAMSCVVAPQCSQPRVSSEHSSW
ncbi:hypothetical protein U6N30_32400 [Blastococcus brunescens]|uniref:Uncharacterized protein n=1 Tax=Blastococcus brunescens TaxID=1564165 RepID=A0ABZ1B4B6_9ACTN|nr:hypothetical protein [Blastococcus sp. BMG 8361]WRL64204.1 hypothetical protein U6N30_32400 [Blastococcus sp. BMG 8361]